MPNYKKTLYASYLGYITQAIVNNLAPLLFLTFQRQFSVSLAKIALLITVNFGVQILTDLAACKFVDRIGYKPCIVAAHIFTTIGLIGMGTLPFLIPNAFIGLLIATCTNAIGGGLIEVLVSPIVEALPGDEKASAMSLLHSFYCWGHVAVVVLSTLYFRIAGMENWFYLPIIWAIIPLCNVFLFLTSPIRTLTEEHEAIPLKSLFTKQAFIVLLLLMICAGASEQAMSQWSSLFAEAGLGVSKTVGDLLGPCAFALLMGTSRAIYGNLGGKWNLERTMIASSILCIFSYLVAVFSSNPLLSLLGCSLCGLSVGILWPGTFSLSTKHFPTGGTALFAILALGGDIGCATGPGFVGFISDLVKTKRLTFTTTLFETQTLTQIGLKSGLLFAIVFPIVMVLGVWCLLRRRDA